MASKGQLSKYKPEYDEKAFRYRLIGMTMPQIAEALDVHIDTLYEWMKVHESFSEAIKNGGVDADGKVVRSLWQRACGYDQVVQKVVVADGSPQIVEYVEKIPPDVGAMAMWMKNRQPDKWRDRRPADDGPIEVSIVSYAAEKKEESDEK